MTDDSVNRHPRRRWLQWLEALGLAVLAALIWFLTLTVIGIVHRGNAAGSRTRQMPLSYSARRSIPAVPRPCCGRGSIMPSIFSRRGSLPWSLSTGGAASDPSFSEGGVGSDYLKHRGIPERDLIAETQGSDTAQSAVRVAVIMRANGLHSCVAVSDAYHVFRIKRLLEHEGIGPVYVAPRPDSRPHSAAQRAYAVMREATSYLLWKLGMS